MGVKAAFDAVMTGCPKLGGHTIKLAPKHKVRIRPDVPLLGAEDRMFELALERELGI